MADPKWITDGYDLHLVGPVPGDGTSRSFELGNYFLPDGLSLWSANHRNFTFSPVFTFTPQRHGLIVDPNTGTLTFSSATQGNGDVIRNFIVNAVAGGVSVPLRIHRHDELVDASITPTQLTIHENSTMQFSILATFKDKSHTGQLTSIGDLSRHPGLGWSLAPGAPTQPLIVASGGQILSFQAGFSVGVQVLLPDSLYRVGSLPAAAQRTKTATVKTVQGWDADQPDDAALQPIGKCTSADRIADVPNVLFLPDGIQSRTDFVAVLPPRRTSSSARSGAT